MTGQAGDAQAALGWQVVTLRDGRVLVNRPMPDQESALAEEAKVNKACEHEHYDWRVAAVALVPAAAYDRLRAASEALARVEALVERLDTLPHPLRLTDPNTIRDAINVTGTGAGHETSGP